ncbi:MAG: CarD family transcriptional regulator [Firmicutes bacterium]|nr:CarD family transcriptional regulator [Bacillota bacterium]
MKAKGEYIVYRKEVCIIKDIIEMNGEKYYALFPLGDESLLLKVPVSNQFLRSPISKAQAEILIDSIPNITTLNLNEKMIEHEYQTLLSTSSLEDLIKIIKTTYLRNARRASEGKKLGEKDEFYFQKAEKLLYTELSISLDLTIPKVKEYITNKLSLK